MLNNVAWYGNHPPWLTRTGTIDMPQNVYSVVMYKLCVPTLSQSEGLVWYAAALLLPCWFSTATSLFCSY